MDIYCAPLDCCNEQLVLIQRCVRFLVVSVGPNVQLCVVICVFSVLQYILRSPFLHSLTLTHTAIVRHPSTFVRPSRFPLTPYLNGAHMSHMDPLAPSPVSTLLIRNPPFSPTSVRISQCRSFRLIRERGRITIISCRCWDCGNNTTITRLCSSAPESGPPRRRVFRGHLKPAVSRLDLLSAFPIPFLMRASVV